jgi:predicted alpha-1,2-mannosidase
MVGDPAAIVIADTYLKGVRGFDAAKAYAAMRKSATTATSANRLRPCLAEYVRHGYVPSDACRAKGSVSVTQEFAYADQAVAKLAGALGKADDRALFARRALSHRNLFDAGTGFLRPRNASGGFATPFDPLCCALGSGKYEGPGYIEGTAWQYLFMVPHDVPGLIDLLGGDAAFVAKLDRAFTNAGGYYTLINQPDMAYPYLYTYAPGQAWRTQERVRQDIASNFGPGRSGLPGNDDAGQTSSRLVFDMLGFYPADPLSGEYRIGSPVFASAKIRLNGAYYRGAEFTVRADGASNSNKYVLSATLNGGSFGAAHISHEAVTRGGTLTLRMGASPSGWGG